MKFSPKDPRVKLAQKILGQQAEKALAAPMRVEDSVLPLYFPLKSDSKPEQFASGVAVKIGGQCFIFSASHVFDTVGEYRLLLGFGDGSQLIALAGERFSTGRGPSGSHADDPIDASVFHIQSDLPERFRQVALTFDDLDLSQPGKSESVFLVSGFRAKESKTLGKRADANRGCYPSLEYGAEEYAALELDIEKHIAIAFEDQILVDERWQTSPLLKGVSGGAVIKVEGVSVAPPFNAQPNPRQLLTAIAIEHRRGKARKPAAVVGTRIGVHLALIRKFLPSLEFI